MTLRIADRAFASLTLAALTGYRRGAVSAATNGSNARFWWLTLFTLRDDHAASILYLRKNALRLRPPTGVFLWGATPVSLGKTKEMGWQRVF